MDTTLRLLARTVGKDRLIDEFVFSFTHDIEMDWMLPGIQPTHRKVEIPMVVVGQTSGVFFSWAFAAWRKPAKPKMPISGNRLFMIVLQ